MYDYISRQAAIDAFYKATADGDKIDFCLHVLNQVPFAPVRENVIGDWIVAEHSVKCSVCGWDIGVEPYGWEMTWLYCPNCGAEMSI